MSCLFLSVIILSFSFMCTILVYLMHFAFEIFYFSFLELTENYNSLPLSQVLFLFLKRREIFSEKYIFFYKNKLMLNLFEIKTP